MTQNFGTSHSVNYLETFFSQAFPKEVITVVIVSILHMDEGSRGGRKGGQAEINEMTCSKYSNSLDQDQEKTPKTYH